jgi:hypothetical protein
MTARKEFVGRLTAWLEVAGIPFMVTGSLASSYYGKPRSTQDVDVVIDPTPEQLDHFLSLVGDDWYVSREGAREALHRRSMFNVIDFAGGGKADFIVRKDRPFSIEEFQRRRVGTLLERPVPIASPEDVVLSKLEWDKITPSQRQVEDARYVVLTHRTNLDKDYLRRWAVELGVADKLEELLHQAEQQQ